MTGKRIVLADDHALAREGATRGITRCDEVMSGSGDVDAGGA